MKVTKRKHRKRWSWMTFLINDATNAIEKHAIKMNLHYVLFLLFFQMHNNSVSNMRNLSNSSRFTETPILPALF